MGYLSRLKVRALAAAGAVPLVIGAVGMSPGSVTNAFAASQSTGHAVYRGTGVPQLGGAGAGAPTSPHLLGQHEVGRASSTDGPTRLLPSPNGTPVSRSAGGATGFPGINIVDQDNAGTGIYAGSQGSLEPPDQALCVGNGFVVGGVNLAFAVYSSAGKQLTAATAYNQFFNVQPESNNGTPPFGDFLSDPKCYFDPVGGRFVQTILQIDAPGNIDGSDRTHVMVAVSATGDPTGAWNLFSFDTSNDGNGGTPGHPGCPCLPDQPLLGANADGIFISTNEFELVGSNFGLFNGSQLYAFSRSELESSSGGSTPAFVHIDVGQVSTGDRNLPFWGSIQPSTSPRPGRGTELLMSGGPEDIFQNNGLVDNRIAVWALTGTNTLSSDEPSLQLSHRVLRSEAYGSNVAAGFGATQKSGPTPLRDFLNAPPFNETNPLSQLNANDSRMNQVTFANGKLFGAVNTAITSRGKPNRVGIAYFVVGVQGDAQGEGDNAVSAQIAKQGYVAANGENVLFPSIGVNANGVGAMAFSVSGPDFFPSSAYVRFSEDGPSGPIHVTGAGVAPDDGFTAYQFFRGNGIGRWGDYSAAVASGGSVWMAAEFIPGPRDFFANWGTFISRVSIGDENNNGGQ
jgi:hypothetical protein